MRKKNVDADYGGKYFTSMELDMLYFRVVISHNIIHTICIVKYVVSLVSDSYR